MTIPVVVTSLCLLLPALGEAPLPSWNEGPTKNRILGFIEKINHQKDKQSFIPPNERIAVFDNDGTLWSEKPIYFQLAFALHRIRAMAKDHPEWKDEEPYASVLKGDVDGALKEGEPALMKILKATHTDVSSDDFSAAVREWLKTARHPKTQLPYHKMVYLPMLELLEHLRDSGFKTYIVSGGGVDFMRVFAEETYGIPPEQVIGSSFSAKYELVDGKPTIIKTDDSFFVDDKEGKPVGIHQHIGRRPVFAGGNSDGDFEMLEYTTAGEGLRLAMIVHHDDAEREWAYDRDSPIGKLVRGLDEGPKRGWTIVSMKNDWSTIFPRQK